MEKTFEDALAELIAAYVERATPLEEIATALELQGYAIDEEIEAGE